jgi:hypothetical protein
LAKFIKPVGIWMLANVAVIIRVVPHGQANCTMVKLLQLTCGKFLFPIFFI